jgi:hypothetical protein
MTDDDVSMADPLLIALVPAAAALAGGIQLERVRWRRMTAAQENERAVATKRAVRLVERELFEAEMRIARSARTGYFAPADRRCATAEWRQHSGELAEELGVADWHRVTAAYDAIVDLNETLDQRLGPFRNADPANIGQAVTSAFAEAKLSQVRESDKLELRWRAIRTASWILRAQIGDSEKLVWALAEDERLAAELWPRQPAGTAPEAAAGSEPEGTNRDSAVAEPQEPRV